MRRENRVPVHYTFVDGKGVGDVGTLVLKERHILGGEGMVLVVLVRDAESGSILHGPQMISKGFVFHQHFEHLLEDAKCLVLDQLEENRSASPEKLGEGIRASLRRFFRRILDRDPVIVPIITDV
jgi:ribonuclease J